MPLGHGAEQMPVMGLPEPKRVSTSYVERSNLSIRMHNRRFTRLTNAFPKKVDKANPHAVTLLRVQQLLPHSQDPVRQPAMALASAAPCATWIGWSA